MFKQKLTERKKYNGFIWVLLAVFALLAAAGGFLSVCGSEVSAEAAGSNDSLTPDDASLFLPDSYEQYLSLNSPVDIAVSERYVAIAEESTIYVFDRNEETPVYHKYVHEKAQISKIQFSDEGRLYFSDRLLGFYELNLTNLTELTTTTKDPLTSLTTFYLEGSNIFEVSVVTTGTTYLSAPISSPNDRVQFDHNELTNTPQLGFSNGNFYSIVGALVTVYSKNAGTNKYEATNNLTLQSGLSGLKAAIVIGDSLFYTIDGLSSVIENGLYHKGLSSEEPTLVLAGNGFGALTSYDGKLYAVKGNAVMEYSLEGGVKKTDYEISSSSDSVNRLSNATDSARAGNLLVTADAGNHRLSVYDMGKQDYSVISIRYDPKFVATDGEIIAVAASDSIYVYAKDRLGNFTNVYIHDTNTVSGIVCLYGKCYFVTHNFGYGVIEETEDGYAATARTRDSFSEQAPTALTSDLYGNLYVVRSDGSVVRFTEENFANNNTAQGESLDFSLPEGFKDVEADFEGHIYCLVGNVLYQNGKAFTSIDGKDFVYTDKETIPPVSYALGFEDDCVYFNFGNFIVRTNAGALGFPTLSTIDAAGIRETLDAVHAPEEVRHMDVQQGAIGIKVDLATLTEDTVYFPYDSYARTEESCRGVLLAEKGNYLLIALYHDRAYDVRLFRNDQCTETEIAAEAHAETKHLSSDCRLYNYPCIADAYSETLPRGTVLKVLSTVAADPDAAAPDLGYTFAYVEVESKSRETVRGYVPLSFLTDTDPAGEGDDSFELAKLKEDAVFTDGEETKRLEKGTEVKLYQNEDGTYLGTYTDEEGRTWSQVLTEDMIERGESDALRISLIVGLSVLALVIIGVYFALLPHKKKS